MACWSSILWWLRMVILLVQRWRMDIKKISLKNFSLLQWHTFTLPTTFWYFGISSFVQVLYILYALLAMCLPSCMPSSCVLYALLACAACTSIVEFTMVNLDLPPSSIVIILTNKRGVTPSSRFSSSYLTPFLSPQVLILQRNFVLREGATTLNTSLVNKGLLTYIGGWTNFTRGATGPSNSCTFM